MWIKKSTRIGNSPGSLKKKQKKERESDLDLEEEVVGVGGWSRVLPWTCCGAICPSGIMNNDEGMRIEEATKQNPKIVGKK